MGNKFYGLLGMVIPLVFWITYFVLSSIHPSYSIYTKAVSELGAVGAPHLWIWNSIGYISVGVHISVYGYGLYKNMATEKSSKIPLYGIVLSGAFMAISGIFPGDFENKQSLTMLLHTVGSFGSYLFFLGAAFTYPKLMISSSYWKVAKYPTLTFTYLTIIFGTWPFLFPEIPSLGQRFVFLSYFLWIFYTAFKLYKKS